jgi:hypothetical protein
MAKERVTVVRLTLSERHANGAKGIEGHDRRRLRRNYGTPSWYDQQPYGGTQSALSTTLLLWVAVGKRESLSRVRRAPA